MARQFKQNISEWSKGAIVTSTYGDKIPLNSISFARNAAWAKYGFPSKRLGCAMYTPTGQTGKNPITALSIKRDGKVIKPATQTVDEAGGRFIFDPIVFAPTGPLTIELVGKSATRSCVVSPDVLRTLR